MYECTGARRIDISRDNRHRDVLSSFRYFLSSLALSRYARIFTIPFVLYPPDIIFDLSQKQYSSFPLLERSERRIFRRHKNVSVFARDCKTRASNCTCFVFANGIRENVCFISIWGRRDKERGERDEGRCFCVWSLTHPNFSRCSLILGDHFWSRTRFARLAHRVRESRFFSFRWLFSIYREIAIFLDCSSQNVRLWETDLREKFLRASSQPRIALNHENRPRRSTKARLSSIICE